MRYDRRSQTHRHNGGKRRDIQKIVNSMGNDLMKTKTIRAADLDLSELVLCLICIPNQCLSVSIFDSGKQQFVNHEYFTNGDMAHEYFRCFAV